MFDTAGVDETVGGISTSKKVTGWSVKRIVDEARKEAPAELA